MKYILKQKMIGGVKKTGWFF